MKSSKLNPDLAKNLATRWQVMMSVSHFQSDVQHAAAKINELSKRLLEHYAQAVDFLKSDLDVSQMRKAEEHLTHLRVHANHMNHALEVVSDAVDGDEAHPALSEQLKVYGLRMARLRESALALESLGSGVLAGDERELWQEKFCCFEGVYGPELEKQTDFLKLINSFYERFSPKELEHIARVIAENRVDIPEMDNSELYEKQYLKAFAQFRREFHSQNLWDMFLEVLSGGVHPSPEEKMMLNQWIEGKPKEKPGGLDEII